MNIKKYFKILVIAFFTSQSLYSDYSENDEIPNNKIKEESQNI